MVGIRSYGAYVPMRRLPFAAMGSGRKGGGERSVAGFDEDAVTMGVAAATDCLTGLDRTAVDGLLFASTTYPLQEKQAASVVAKALDLRRDVFTADLGHSTRAGTAALRAALDAVRAGTARNVLVVTGDVRIAPPRSAMERSFGDGAAALLVSADEVLASVEAQHSLSEEIIDVWRTDRDRFVRQWEDRFVVEHGYARTMIAAVRALLEKNDTDVSAITRAALYAPDPRSHAATARRLRLDPANQVQDPLFGRIGNTGAAFTPMLLVAALERSTPGDLLLLAGYGDGADAFLLRVTEQARVLPPRRGVSAFLERRAKLADYDTYLRFRHLAPSDRDPHAGAGVSATIHYRERDMDISLHGHRCRRCGTEQFPFQRVCFSCYARDDFDAVRLSDRTARVMSYTFDYFAGSPEPPMIVTMTEAEGGARLYLQMTDAKPDELALDLPVELTFRKIHEYGGTPNYFWKCTPIR